MPPVKIVYTKLPTTDQLVPLTATYYPSQPIGYQARLIAPIAQQLVTTVTSPDFYQFQLVFLKPPQGNLYFFNFQAPSGAFAVDWLGGVFPLTISANWTTDQLFPETIKPATAQMNVYLPAKALSSLPAAVYWAQFQWNMEPAGLITTPIATLQSTQLGVFLGYQQQLLSLLTFNNSAQLEAILKNNLAYVNAQILILDALI